MHNRTPPVSRWQALLSLAIATFGIPAAWLILVYTIGLGLRLNIALIIIYELLLLLICTMTKVWRRLNEPWLVQIGQWISMRVQWIIFRPKSQYWRYMQTEYRNLDMKGIGHQGTFPLALRQIFVEPIIVPAPIPPTSTGPLQIPSSLSEGKHPLWDYLSSPALNGQHLVITGGPGSGKTTLLQHIVLTLLRQNIQTRSIRVPRKLPMLLFLSDHTERIVKSTQGRSDFWLEEALQDQLKQHHHKSLPSGWTRHQLNKGRCLVLLDGLDEVADPEKCQQVMNWIEQQMRLYSENRFLVTSRFGSKAYLLQEITTLKIEKFSPEQIERFVHQWYLANEVMSLRKDEARVRLKALNEAEKLLKSIRTVPDLFNFAVSPLLLTMMATIHRHREELPDKRATLYKELCEISLGRCQPATEKGPVLTTDQQHEILQYLAYAMMERGMPAISLADASQIITEPLRQITSDLPPKAFLQLVNSHSGLLLERVSEVYSFAHVTFQEYLAARYIKEQNLEHLLVQHATENRWLETIRHYCALADSSCIVAACLTNQASLAATLTLVTESHEGASAIDSSTADQLGPWLAQRTEDLDPELRYLAAEALLDRRLQHMAPMHDHAYIDTTLITNAEYQVFLDQQRARGNFFQPDHWSVPHFAPGQATAPIAGVRYSDAVAFCVWLTERDTHFWHYRLPRENELRYLQEMRREMITVEIKMGHWIESHRVDIKMVPYQSDQARQNIQDILNRDCASDLVHALNLVLTLTRVQAPDLANARVINLVRAFERDLDHALARALTRNIGFDLNCALDRAFNLTHALNANLALTRNMALDLDLALNRALDRDLARALAPNLARTLDRALAPDFIFALDRLRRLALNRTFALSKEHAELLRWYLRFSVYTLAQMSLYLLYFLDSPQRSSVLRFASGRQREKEAFERVIEQSLNLYIALALLEERIRGRFPTWEGILLVKERKRDSM